MLISSWIDLNKSTSQRLFIGLDSANSISLVFHVCHKSNLQSSIAFKQNKYENIANFRRDSRRKVPVKLFTIEVSILGFISDLDKFTASACLPNLPSSLKYKLIHKNKIGITKIILIFKPFSECKNVETRYILFIEEMRGINIKKNINILI